MRLITIGILLLFPIITFAQSGITIPGTPRVWSSGSVEITYPGSPFCTSAGPVDVLLTGTPGGTFSASPVGLTIDPSTGQINPGTSLPGNYTVMYTLEGRGGCGTFVSSSLVSIIAASTAGGFAADDFFKLYPNPNNGTFTVDYESGKISPVRLSVLDLTGRVVMDQLLTGSASFSEEIRLSEGSQGIFFVRVISESGVINRKILVE